MSLRRTEAGIPVLRIHYTADPDKRSIEWREQQRRGYTSQAWWDLEMEINYEAQSGQLIYPEWNPMVHVIPDSQVPKRGCIYMALDPHPRTPHAFLWILIDRWGDWYCFRELWPSVVYGKPDILRDSDEENRYTIKEYAETVAWQEGNNIEWHHVGKDEEYGVWKDRHCSQCRCGGKHETVAGRYMDQAGKAFKASAEAALNETYAMRYSRFGLAFGDPKKSHRTGEDAIHDLLKKRRVDEGFAQARGIVGDPVWPRLHVAASLIELQSEFENHRYKATRTLTLERDLKQDQAEYRCHLLDLMRYLATAPIGWYASMETTRHQLIL